MNTFPDFGEEIFREKVAQYIYEEVQHVLYSRSPLPGEYIVTYRSYYKLCSIFLTPEQSKHIRNGNDLYNKILCYMPMFYTKGKKNVDVRIINTANDCAVFVSQHIDPAVSFNCFPPWIRRVAETHYPGLCYFGLAIHIRNLSLNVKDLPTQCQPMDLPSQTTSVPAVLAGQPAKSSDAQVQDIPTPQTTTEQ